jgi:hypothetical protein
VIDWAAVWEVLSTMDWEKLLGNFVTLALSAFALFKFGARQAAHRDHIRGDLALIQDVEKNDFLRENTAALAWLHGKVVVDIAKLAHVSLGTKKRPLNIPSLIFSGLGSLGFGWWTYSLNSAGFSWPSLITGLLAVLFMMSFSGLFMNREIPPDEALPPGAVELRTETASEQVASLVLSGAEIAQPDVDDARSVALVAFGLLQNGNYEDALKLTDPDWLEGRLRSWLWNEGRLANTPPVAANVTRILADMIAQRGAHEQWQAFIEFESNAFESSLRSFGRVGAGNRRRQVAPDLDIVVLASVGDTDGYWIADAAMVAGLRFLMRRHEDGWKLLNDVAGAPPILSWPPVWWTVNDPSIIEASAAPYSN